MRAFVAGATGFIGGRVAAQLRERGDEVVALIRSPDKASAVRDAGAELVAGDLSDPDAIRRGVEGADAVFHVAAMYKVGIPKSERPAMWEANVIGTERVLDAAIEAGARRIVHVSTINAFGNTKGAVVDETYHRPEDDPFLTYYDQTKYRAHRAAEERIANGAPTLIAQPGGVYGPGDPSELANLIDQVATGRLKFKMFPETGFNFLHVDDAARGTLLIHDNGRVGQAYVLGGEVVRMGGVMDRIAAVAGRKPPRVTMPKVLMKSAIPFGRVVGKIMRMPPNLRELIRAADGVTYWATDAKARKELGYTSRDLAVGLRETVRA